MIEEKRICRICGKEYPHTAEQTISFLTEGNGKEYVACPSCFDKYKTYVEGKIKYRREQLK